MHLACGMGAQSIEQKDSGALRNAVSAYMSLATRLNNFIIDNNIEK